MTPTTANVWQELSGDLRRFIRRRVADDHTADDLLQDVFLRIHRNLPSLADADRLAAWVYQIARNILSDHYRRIGQPAPLDDDVAETEADQPATCVCGAEHWLHELIGQLPEPYQTAVRLAEIEGLTQREIAERYGLSLPGAKSRVQRGRALLKEALDACCVFHADARGNVYDYDPRPERTICRDCDPQ